MARNDEKYRLFFALYPPQTTQSALAAFLHANPASGKPVPTANWHMTLLFMGVVDRPTCERLQAVQMPALPTVFSVTLNRCGWWLRSRVGYLAPEPPPKALFRLHQVVYSAAQTSGLSVKCSPYHPHVTLLRRLSLPWKPFQTPSIDWPVTQVHLLRSFLSSHGPLYQSLASWPLPLRKKN